MRADSIRKRRMRLLKELAVKSKGRHDAKLPLSEVASSLDIQSFVDGSKFVDKYARRYEGGSDHAYDLNTLREDSLIQPTFLDYDQDCLGGAIPKNPAVVVTRKGFDTLSEFRKSWLRKSIDKQPITFLHLLATTAFSVASFIGGWWIRGLVVQ